jgi:hypothetical protein
MPRKPKYINPVQTIEEFFASVSDSYHHPAAGEETGCPARKKQELLAEEFSISRIKVRKILITTGDLTYPETRLIQELLAAGLKMDQLCEQLQMAPSTVNSLLPHSKGVYGLDVSAAADRTEVYRARKAAVEELKDAVKCGDWSLELWKAICLFAGYPFSTTGRKQKTAASCMKAPSGRNFDHDGAFTISGLDFCNQSVIIPIVNERKRITITRLAKSSQI